MLNFLNDIAGILLMVLALSFAVMIHEFGHFLIAKKRGLYVAQFSIGFGPTLFKFQKGETTYCIKAILFGGYVLMASEPGDEVTKMVGMKADEQSIPFERTYASLKPKWQAILSFMGPFFNLVLGFVIILGLVWFNGKPEAHTEAMITVADNSAMADAGIQTGDKVISIQIGQTGEKIIINDFNDLLDKVGKEYKEENEICFNIERTTELKCATRSEKGLLGFGAFYNYKGKGNIVELVPAAAEWTWESSTQILGAFGNIFKNLFTGQGVAADVSGPIGIVSMGPKILESGFPTFMSVLAMLSLNFFVLNLLPFPPLDGSKILFAGYEAIAKKKPSEKFIKIVTNIGVIAFFGLFILLAFKDVFNLFK